MWCTVTSANEARQAGAAAVDALVVQGAEAGGHQGSFEDSDDEPQPLRDLLASVAGATGVPLVATGGISSGADIAAALAAGAVAVQLGSALLLATKPGRRRRTAGVAGESPTRLTRAFTGRRARGIVNRFLDEHDAFAPRGYPEIHYLTAPIRAAARADGDPDGINLWAGTGYRQMHAGSASELVELWASEFAR